MKTHNLEIYELNSASPFMMLDTHFQPDVDNVLNILDVKWKVVERSFTITHTPTFGQIIRCNVTVEKLSKHAALPVIKRA